MTDHTPRIGTALAFTAIDNAVDAIIDRAARAAEVGVDSLWLGQRFDYDAISLAGLIGREVPGVTVGTSAVPIFGRHPLLVAAAAQTSQAATHGRFRLGLALGAAALTEKAFGIELRRPVARLADFVTATRALLSTGSVDFHGSELSAVSPFPTSLAGADPAPPILVAALGPRALEVSGRLADGVLPFLASPTVLAEHVVPTLRTAAEKAGRPTPRVVALVPALVTNDPGHGREALAQATALYDTIPSYQRVIAQGGFRNAAQLGLVGAPEHVRAGLHDYFDAGADEVVVTQTGLLGLDVELDTWAVAAGLGRERTETPV